MQHKLEDGGAREAELMEVLSSYAEPRAVGFGFVAGYALLGLLACGLLAWLAVRAPRRAPLRFEPEPAASFGRGVAAYRAGDWAEAERQLREARSTTQEPVPRIDDYLERLELIGRDEERLSRAQQALVANEPQRALAFAGLIAPNSPLFAEAESLGRSARAQLGNRAKERAERAQAERATEARSAEREGVPTSERRTRRSRGRRGLGDEAGNW